MVIYNSYKIYHYYYFIISETCFRVLQIVKGSVVRTGGKKREYVLEKKVS